MTTNLRISTHFRPIGANGTTAAGDPAGVDVSVRRDLVEDTEDTEDFTMPVVTKSSVATLDSSGDSRRSAGRARLVQELFEAHHGRVLAFLRRLTTGERAEDLAQEVFFRLFTVKNLESREISVSYLFRIGENLVRKGYHREVRHRRAGEDLRHRAGAGIDPGADPTSSTSSEMTFVSGSTLRRAMDLLTDNEQAAIRLIICRGLSYEQAARSLGVNVSTINNWKHRGVKKLKHIIEDARGARGVEGPSARSADPGVHPRRVAGRQGSDPRPHRGGRLPHRRVVELETDGRRESLARRAG